MHQNIDTDLIAALLREGAEMIFDQEKSQWERANTTLSWEEWRSEWNKDLYKQMNEQADKLEEREPWI